MAGKNLFLEYFGTQAENRLAEVINRLKAADRLNPVTVIVPSMYAGVAIRRSLARENGLINVRFMVIPRLAEYLGSGALAALGKPALTPVVKLAAIRHYAASLSGRKPLGAIASHPPLHEYLAGTFEELDLLSEKELSWLEGQSTLTGQVVEWYRNYKILTAPYYDREELAASAARAISTGTASGVIKDLGKVIFYLPGSLSPAERNMVKALGSQGLCIVILGLTGEEEANREPLKLAGILEPELGKAAMSTSKPTTPTACHISVAPDPYEEVRQVVRHVIHQAEKGIPFHQMAILYRSSEPYAELVKTQLKLAGIPAAGLNPVPLKDSTGGRSLLNLLKIFESDFSRESLIRWVAESPVNLGVEERLAQQAAAMWEEVSGKAGIIGGALQWQERLDLYQSDNSHKYRQKFYQPKDSENSAFEQLALQLKAAAQLKEFVAGLWQNRPPENGAGWKELARWARDVTEKYSLLQFAPTPEQEQYEKVLSVLDELGRLSVIEPGPVSFAVFTQALESSLSSSSGRLGATGSGVLSSQLSSARGMNFHVVHILGMAEGSFPPNTRDDAIIPDQLRLELGDGCPLKIRKTTKAEERRAYLAVCASARERFLSFSRSGGATGRRNYPAPWLVEEAGILHKASLKTSEPEKNGALAVKSSNLEQLSGESWLTVIQSGYDSLAGLGGLVPADLHDYDMHSLATWHSLGKKLQHHYLAAKEEDWRHALQAEQARRSPAFTPWDGNLGTLAGTSPRLGIPGETPRSPTQMECWATCPFKYFLKHVLKIEEVEKPEEITTISALDRGSLVHHILERFINAVIESGHLPASSEAWNDSRRELLMGIARQEMDAVERAGITGRKLLWEVVRNEIMDDLDKFLEKDNRKRAELGISPVAVERKFGFSQGQPPVELKLADSKKISFKGVIDRIDTGANMVMVIDYKTGSSKNYPSKKQDPFNSGTRLQLPVYAMAAKNMYKDERETRAAYWFVSAAGKFLFKEMSFNAEAEKQFSRLVEIIVNGIESGIFPANPGGENSPNCQYCDYQTVCPADADLAWQRKSVNPELKAYLDMASTGNSEEEEE